MSAGTSGAMPIRPYFGWSLGGRPGGPQVRTARLAEAFGNFKIRPNVLYLNSSGIPSRREAALVRTLNPGLKVVYNQNGVFYPAWYSSSDPNEWREKNATMLAKARGADRVLFQSQFCKTALEEVTGAKVEGEVLYNAAPDFGFKTRFARSERSQVTLAMTANFGLDCEHFLAPAVGAMEILSKKWGPSCPKLILLGSFNEIEVFNLPKLAHLRSLFEELRSRGVIASHGPYSTDRLAEAYADVDLALHLRDQDACPNAVIERMSLGLGHVYLDSGGTSELVGDAGVKVAAPEGFRVDDFFCASPDSVAQAIDAAVTQTTTLSERARARYEAHFTWPKYVTAHRRVFESVLAKARGKEGHDGNRKTFEAHL